ncbi:AraC family transcriptional regulator [Teredinibacter sp. KSP-S5-2]|uniref:AraC family transcriptional regulator n=1 Tax=Teredinibacter sp. KSP-S5-2 TaxID=3034506 RepID=UPI0029347D54|nr:AraC family transcriptional regulator [Teredinibacter sp. KSP-S5-2]WNO11136.1 AraC family transcriptional regulator [Teredinibacter sp. KSP-S5-2]
MKLATEKNYQVRLIHVLNYIYSHLDSPLALEELASVACFSRYHFHRIFKGFLGESVKELIRRLRMERSAIELRATQDTILDIAQRAGYESDMAYSRAFKAIVGITPSAYRASSQWMFPCLIDNGIRYRTSERITAFKPIQYEDAVMNVVIKEMNDIHVACVRHTGPYRECSKAWDQLCSVLGPEGMLAGDIKFLGVCYDDPDETPSEEIRYDACVTVPQNYQASGEGVDVKTLEGGRYATITHFGPYEKLSDTYRALYGKWLKDSGYEAADKPCIEIYMNDPESTAPEDLVTDIYLPLGEK